MTDPFFGALNRVTVSPGVVATVCDGVRGMSWLSAAELGSLVQALPHGGRFLEIGTASGATAAVIVRTRPDVSVVCVDTFINDLAVATTEEGGRLINWFINRCQAPERMTLWLGTAQSLACLAPAKFDAVLVDADHLYDAVAADLVAAESLLAQGGRLLAHDYASTAWPDVTRAVDDFCVARNYVVNCLAGALVELRRN